MDPATSVEVSYTGAPCRNVPSVSAAISSRQAASRAASTRSVFVSATTPVSTPTMASMSRCSLLCGIGPSSAAMTKSACWRLATPATMLWMNLWCPGTSTKPMRPSSM